MFDPLAMCRVLNEEVGEGLVVWVAALEDIIASKRAVNRPKDQMALPYLESLREQRDKG